MFRGVRVARLFGIEIIIDQSWLLISFLMSWSFSNVFSDLIRRPRLSDGAYLAMGIAAMLLFFASLIAHELGHSLVAQRKGIQVASITLFIFGGVARIRKEPDSPGDEFQIAIAGPIVSVVLGGVFLGLGFLLGTLGERLVGSILMFVGAANLTVAAFNMFPGFPLDGGRILRAAVWRVTGDVVKATKAASVGGQVIAWILIGLGVFTMIVDGDLFRGVWLILIGLFLFNAASSGYQQLLLRRSLRGLTVADLMSADPVSIPGNTRVDESIDSYFLRHRHTAFPVLGFGGQVEGIVTLQHVKDTPREQWPELTIRQVMTPLAPETSARPDEPLAMIFDRLQRNPLGRFVVVDDGNLRGILSASDLARHFRIRAAVNGTRSPV